VVSFCKKAVENVNENVILYAEGYNKRLLYHLLCLLSVMCLHLTKKTSRLKIISLNDESLQNKISSEDVQYFKSSTHELKGLNSVVMLIIFSIKKI
jgi:hypothetical protein